MEEMKLLNGLSIPTLAYGTWLIPNQDAPMCVKMALDAGYRHIDTAQAYENEEGVGLGMKISFLPREEIYLTSKVKAEIKSYKEAKTSIKESLAKLGVEYIDLMLIHCPQPWHLYGSEYRYEKENLAVWKALEEAYEEGLVKAIGVSNFNVHDLENIINNCKIKPMVNQIKIHIGDTPFEIMEYCQKEGIVVEAYSPIAHGRALTNPELVKMAEKYHVTVPQLCIKYTLQLGTVSIPKASSKEHIEANIDLNFNIEYEDMKVLKDFPKI